MSPNYYTHYVDVPSKTNSLLFYCKNFKSDTPASIIADVLFYLFVNNVSRHHRFCTGYSKFVRYNRVCMSPYS